MDAVYLIWQWRGPMPIRPNTHTHTMCNVAVIVGLREKDEKLAKIGSLYGNRKLFRFPSIPLGLPWALGFRPCLWWLSIAPMVFEIMTWRCTAAMHWYKSSLDHFASYTTYQIHSGTYDDCAWPMAMHSHIFVHVFVCASVQYSNSCCLIQLKWTLFGFTNPKGTASLIPSVQIQSYLLLFFALSVSLFDRMTCTIIWPSPINYMNVCVCMYRWMLHANHMHLNEIPQFVLFTSICIVSLRYDAAPDSSVQFLLLGDSRILHWFKIYLPAWLCSVDISMGKMARWPLPGQQSSQIVNMHFL